jgi:hypothetical protein
VLAWLKKGKLWGPSAPEILGEIPDTDYILINIYAFGIILWELLTYEMPFPRLRFV